MTVLLPEFHSDMSSQLDVSVVDLLHGPMAPSLCPLDGRVCNGFPKGLPPFPQEERLVSKKNKLFAAENLGVLEKMASENVDLIYLDPPFNSNQNYNIIFEDRHGRRSTSQRWVFEDTWTWSPRTEESCLVLEEAGGSLSDAIRALRTFLGDSEMMAYLVMMAPRLREMHRVLKPTGSIYLHCDPSASHYLKILMDAIFGAGNFLNEVIWKRTTAHSSSKRYGPAHDILFYYAKSKLYTWNPQYLPQSDKYKAKFGKTDKKTGLTFQDHDLTGPGVRAGLSGKPWRGFDPTEKRRHWQIASYLDMKYKVITGKELKDYPLSERLDKLDDADLIYWPVKKGGFPRYKRFLVDAAGAQLLDIWTDISVINSQANERLPYPTQKPLALLDRLIKTSSNPGDIVLDPFCGCGTAIEASEKNLRRWIGIDVTLLATAVIKTRLVDEFGPKVFKTVEISGEPVNADEAEALAEEDKFGFQWWAAGRLGAPPIEHKRGADRGIDGRIHFHDDAGAPKHIVISVKGGHVGPAAVRELRGVVERDRASMGILVTVKHRTQEMLREANVAGLYKSINGAFPKLQIITVADIFADKPLNLPGRKINAYEPKRPASAPMPAEQLRLLP